MINDKLTLLVGTCDSYLSLMDNFVILFNKYFGDLSINKIIVGEEQKLQYDGYNFLTPGKIQWGERMLIGCNQIKTKYTFFLLEDYYLSQKLTDYYIEYLITFMERQNAKKIIITTVPDFANYKYEETINTIKRMSPDSEYLSSAQPAIWNTEHLKNIFESNYSPWDFEEKGSAKLKGIEKNHYCIKLDEPIYFNMARQGGYLSEGYDKFLEKEGLSL